LNDGCKDTVARSKLPHCLPKWWGIMNSNFLKTYSPGSGH
jgi:hypothetical protein